MRDRGQAVPGNFDFSDCPPDLRTKVIAGQGFIHWAKGGKPLDCGEDCFRRPFLTQSFNRTLPNMRQVEVFGRLNFVVDKTFDRPLTYGFTVSVRCEALNGSRAGRLRSRIAFDPPVIGGPGPLEGIASFFTAGWLSDVVRRKIEDKLKLLDTRSETRGPCMSVGVSLSDRGPSFDTVIYTAPRNVFPIGADSVGGRARVEFLGLRRSGAVAPPNPDAVLNPDLERQFSIFLNGRHIVLPPASLPPGGDLPLNLCKTIDVRDWDRLQLLFVHGLGGAVWSQFPRSANFGAGGLRRMTTSRIVEQPLPGARRPGSGPEPSNAQLREFELRYRIIFNRASNPVVAPEGGTRGSGDLAVAVDPDAPPNPPCREL